MHFLLYTCILLKKVKIKNGLSGVQLMYIQNLFMQ